MQFEDIVDMDWLSSDAIDPALTSPETDIFIKQEDILDTGLLSPPSSAASTFDCLYPSTTQLIMPSVEQIKQLIELAKRQLALREQLTPEPDGVPNTILSTHDSTDTVAIPDTVSPQSLIKHGKSSTKRRASNTSHASMECKIEENEKLLSLETMAEADGIDIKNMSSKERRQLRNKISARNFRVRRKEYINTLESQVTDHKRANEKLLHRLNIIEEENKQLKMQVDSLKRQNQLLQQQANNIINKDISILGSKPTETYRQDNSILVS
ncbi:hypothetical protein G6F70_006308 [Rhizopus microsporus]|uniref:BZIP domain-containing protein n=1 Tax=Rhizopus azygosporus TaxID=86630 RepID=A0A367JME4_RHIAZ|nr:hypothetical protein G6F71_006206 [Rhizopus microsporus]RCH91112.1 hypothetical protein CU097_003199 [Rhizopus azygosporus]KAG1197840.1 hypothetical protein G6F70_006308 [Rhizopus microsporus]KAG1212332.1 hypothetical protein G6F69_003811 [Rhizopus microsporus]KAG1229498.1 hypothetical protein G6F67_007109 [Rhizopus microsporus]